jgi:hypothetical protein
MGYYIIVDDDTGEKVPGSRHYEKEWRVATDCYKWNQTRDGSYSVEEREEQSDQTTEDNNDSSMSNYDFIGDDNDDERRETTEDDFNTVGSMWNLGDHSTASSVDRSGLTESINDTIEALDDDIDGDMKEVLQDASRLVQNTRVSNFECPVEACGLGHSHPDHKHDIRESFGVLDSFTDEMEFTPYCHCGVNELSMLMAFFPYITEPVFEDQHEFEEILEVEPDILDSMYRRYVQDDLSVSRAAAVVAGEFGQDESEAVPLGTRDAIKAFFRKRRSIERAAQAAPIAQETRGVIAQNREALEEATSQ